MKHIRQIAAFLVLSSAVAALAQQAETSKAAQLYETAINEMIGGSQNRDPIRAVSDLRESAKLGYAPAQIAMVAYADTQEEAASFCRKAAEQGDSLGQWCIGRAYFLGSGVLKDWSTAETWLRKPVGNPFAAYTIGLIKEERDPNAAPGWYQKAAEQGLPQAQRALARMLLDGTHVKQDKYRAYVWLLVADEIDQSPSIDEGTLESDLGTITTNKAKTEARALAVKVSRTANARGCTGWDGEFGTPPSLPPLEIQKYCR